MKLLFILIFILLNTLNLYSQLSGQAKIDSLLKELPKMKEDTNAVNLLATLSGELRSTNPDKGIEYGMQGLELAKKLKWKKAEADVNNFLGVNYAKKSDYPKALEYYQNALKMHEEIGNKSGIAASLTNIGIIYFRQSDYPKALEYYHKSIKIKKEIGNKSGIAASLTNIGIIYANQSDYPKALEYYQNALKMHEELGNKNGIANNLGNIGIQYEEQSNYPQALEYYHKALKINEELGNKNGIAFNLGNMGYLYLTLSQDSVLSNISEGTELVSLKKEINLNRSIEYSLQAIELLEKIGDLEYRSSFLKNLADAYKQKEDYKKWGTYLEKSQKLKDSVFNQEKSKELGKLEATHDIELAQKEEEVKEKEEARLLAESNSRRDLLQFSGITIFTILIFAVIFFASKKNLSVTMLDTLAFLAFLLIYEFILVFTDPYIDSWSGGAPVYKLMMNFSIALLFIPFHKMEVKFKNKLKAKDGIVS